MTCIFCSSNKESLDLSICSSCIQKLLAVGITKAKEAYDLAIEKGYIGRLEILKQITEGETENGEQQTKPRRHNDRRGIMRTIRSKEKSDKLFAIQRRLAKLKGERSL